MKKNILVVNENLKACDEIKGALQDEYSTEVYCASSIEEAIEVFVKHRFCLVILDVHLAGSDGLKLLGIMRQAKPVPILVLSGKDKPLKRTEALRAGASAYLEEPFELPTSSLLSSVGCGAGYDATLWPPSKKGTI